MNLRILIYIVALCSVNFLFTQTTVDSLTSINNIDYQKRYLERLRLLILQQERKTHVDEIERESYLIEMTNIVIDEVKKRNPNHIYAATSYFRSLERFLYSVNRIILRLREAGATDLVRFAKELRIKIKEGIRAQQVEFKLEKFFERSIQLLLIAEKAFNFAGESGGKESLQSFKNVLNRNLYEVSDSLKYSNPDIITLLSLINERERNEFTHYVVSVNYLEKYILKIIANGKKKENLEFAKVFYERAFIAYDKQRFELSGKLFNTLLKYFQFLEHRSKQRIEYFISLCYFYSNKYGYAETYLEKMLKTPMADKALAYAISDVYRVTGQIDKLERIVERYASLNTTNMFNEAKVDEEFYFKAGHSFFKHQKYQLAIDTFSKIPEEFSLYFDAKLISAMSMYALKSPQAEELFDELIGNTDVSLRISTTALIKRAQISYDKKEFASALDYLAKVDDTNIEDVEEYYTAKAWSLFMYIDQNDSLVKDFSQVKQVIEKFLDVYPVSDFIGEMRTLLGYIKKLEDNLIGAETEYRYVFDLKRYKRLSDELLIEQDSLKLIKDKIDEAMNVAVNRGKKNLFKRFDDLAFRVDTVITQIKYADQTVVSPTSYNDLARLYKIISEMEQLRIVAEQNKDYQLLEVIDLKISRLYTIVLLSELPEKNKLFSYNFFFEHSLSRKISKSEFLNKKYERSITDIEKEKNEINNEVNELLKKKEEYKKRRNFERIASIEISMMRLKQALQRLDFILTVAKQRKPSKNSARIDHWANFTAYELTNVQFVQKTNIETENSEMSEVIKNINQSLKDRKTVITQNVQTIEKTIALMNRRILKERRIAEREKIRDMFKTEFFDESSTEVNEDSLRQIFEQSALGKRVGRSDSTFVDSLGTDSVKQSKLGTNPKNNGQKENQNVEKKSSSAVNKDEEN